MIKTIYGYAAWHRDGFADRTRTQLWACGREQWRCIAVLDRAEDRILVVKPDTSVTSVYWDTETHEDAAKVTAITLLTEFGVIDPVDYLASASEST